MLCDIDSDYYLEVKNQWLRYLIIGGSILVSVAIAMLGIKSLVEAVIYAQPMILRIIKNAYAFVADVVVMMISLPICVSLRKVLHKAFDEVITG